MKWTKESGPGDVTFADDKVDYTTASFSQSGTYVVMLTANDDHVEVSDEVEIVVANRVIDSLQGYCL